MWVDYVFPLLLIVIVILVVDNVITAIKVWRKMKTPDRPGDVTNITVETKSDD